MQGTLKAIVWPYNTDYFMGKVIFIDNKKRFQWSESTKIARINKNDALQDAEQLRKTIIHI